MTFRWGHMRQLDRVSRELLRRAWSADAGPGDALEADVTFAIASGVSDVAGRCDLEEARRMLGFVPQDHWRTEPGRKGSGSAGPDDPRV